MRTQRVKPTKPSSETSEEKAKAGRKRALTRTTEKAIDFSQSIGQSIPLNVGLRAEGQVRIDVSGMKIVPEVAAVRPEIPASLNEVRSEAMNTMLATSKEDVGYTPVQKFLFGATLALFAGVLTFFAAYGFIMLYNDLKRHYEIEPAMVLGEYAGNLSLECKDEMQLNCVRLKGGDYFEIVLDNGFPLPIKCSSTRDGTRPCAYASRYRSDDGHGNKRVEDYVLTFKDGLVIDVK
jgi:hypothetical protein